MARCARGAAARHAAFLTAASPARLPAPPSAHHATAVVPTDSVGEAARDTRSRCALQERARVIFQP